MENSYLPSSQFIKRVIVIFSVIGAVILITKISPNIKNKLITTGTINSVMVKDVVTQDSNKNGIQDWEESLWGLDPTKDGDANKEFIEAKKRKAGISSKNAQITDSTDQISRELFVIASSLKQNGAGKESLDVLAQTIGGEVTPLTFNDVYHMNDIQIVATTKKNMTVYQENLIRLGKKYTLLGIGSELDILATALDRNDSTMLEGLPQIKAAYQNFAKDLKKIPVPLDLGPNHITIMNGLDHTGVSLDTMAKMIEDPLTGLSGMLTYRIYNDQFVDGINTVNKYLYSDIIKR